MDVPQPSGGGQGVNATCLIFYLTVQLLLARISYRV